MSYLCKKKLHKTIAYDLYVGSESDDRNHMYEVGSIHNRVMELIPRLEKNAMINIHHVFKLT